MDDTVSRIVTFLSTHLGEDFSSYSRSLVRKRIAERMIRLPVADTEGYLEWLQADLDEPELLARMVRVRFSCFFRDPLQFELLRNVVIPAILQGCGGQVRGWSAACASGEEPYSLAIICHEALQTSGVAARIQIFGTDIAEDALEEGRQGCYLPDTLSGVTLRRLGDYFTRNGDEYQVRDLLKGMVTFSRHDLLDPRSYVPREALFGGFNLVLCRNFLMYLDQTAYLRVFDNLFRAVAPGGVLMLGNAEAVPERYLPYLERVADFGNMYRKTCS